MFKINQSPTFTRDVSIQIPDGEGFTEAELKTTFRAMPISEADGFDLSTGTGTLDFLKAVVVSFDNLVDDDDNPVPSTPEQISQELDKAYVRLGLVSGYFKGLHKGTLGN